MADFVAKAVSEAHPRSLAWLAPVQSRKAEQWEKVVFPHRKAEHWKYTNLNVIEQGGYHAAPENIEGLDAQAIAHTRIADLESYTLVFVNGYYSEALSSPVDEMPQGMVLTRFADANTEQQTAISEALGSIANQPQHLFATLNSVKLVDGVYIDVAKNTRVAKAVHIIHVTTAQETSASVSPRVFMRLGQGAEATLLEQFASSTGEQNIFTNAVTELEVGENAKLRHYRLHLEDESALHIGGVHTNLQSHARLESFHLALGAKLKRIDCVVNHRGQGAHCELNGVYLPCHKQHVDYHTTIEHAVPRCTTSEVFRGIIADNARAVFNGRIHIHKDAQKTLAELSNKNLLTSNKAEVDTKPELEIYADDVQCAHGATVAQLDDTSLHYFMTRGIAKKDARMMLSFAFINELINQIHDAPVAEFLRPQISTLFAREFVSAGDEL